MTYYKNGDRVIVIQHDDVGHMITNTGMSVLEEPVYSIERIEGFNQADFLGVAWEEAGIDEYATGYNALKERMAEGTYE